MIIVGLTGGIASGKSFVSKYLKKIKIPVHESDMVIKFIYEKPTNNFINFLTELGYGQSIKKNKINKTIIRNEIFEIRSKKIMLENYLHKEVLIDRKKFLLKNKNKDIVFLDIPLLFEKKLEKICDFICLTTAPLKIRKARAIKRTGINEKLFRKIVKNQTTDKHRKKKSNYVIDTSKTKTKTCLQIDYIIYDILNKQK